MIELRPIWEFSSNFLIIVVPNQDRMEKDGAIKVLVKILNETSDDELKVDIFTFLLTFQVPRHGCRSSFRQRSSFQESVRV